jgi:hypothetical protein
LSRALFIRPHLLLLDEPTNHLDLEACVWLEEELKTYPTILVLISHSQVLSSLLSLSVHFFAPKFLSLLFYSIKIFVGLFLFVNFSDTSNSLSCFITTHKMQYGIFQNIPFVAVFFNALVFIY